MRHKGEGAGGGSLGLTPVKGGDRGASVCSTALRKSQAGRQEGPQLPNRGIAGQRCDNLAQT